VTFAAFFVLAGFEGRCMPFNRLRWTTASIAASITNGLVLLQLKVVNQELVCKRVAKSITS